MPFLAPTQFNSLQKPSEGTTVPSLAIKRPLTDSYSFPPPRTSAGRSTGATDSVICGCLLFRDRLAAATQRPPGAELGHLPLGLEVPAKVVDAPLYQTGDDLFC